VSPRIGFLAFLASSAGDPPAADGRGPTRHRIGRDRAAARSRPRTAQSRLAPDLEGPVRPQGADGDRVSGTGGQAEGVHVVVVPGQLDHAVDHDQRRNENSAGSVTYRTRSGKPRRPAPSDRPVDPLSAAADVGGPAAVTPPHRDPGEVPAGTGMAKDVVEVDGRVHEVAALSTVRVAGVE
jgi:hypothetical protein